MWEINDLNKKVEKLTSDKRIQRRLSYVLSWLNIFLEPIYNNPPPPTIEKNKEYVEIYWSNNKGKVSFYIDGEYLSMDHCQNNTVKNYPEPTNMEIYAAFKYIFEIK